MKKILKAVIATILVISMLFSAVSAGAASAIPAADGNNDAASGADFAPDKTGYYISDDLICFGEDALDSVSCTSDGTIFYLYYLENGKTYAVDGSQSPEFVDTAIDSVSVTDRAAFDNLILGVDVEEGAASYSLSYSADIVFVNGETVHTSAVPFICENGIAAGENEVILDIPDYDAESMTIAAYSIEDVIKSVKLKKANGHTTAYVDYRDNIFFEPSGDAVIVINDTQEVVVNRYNYFVYSSRMYSVFSSTEISEDSAVKMKIYISGDAGSAEIASYNCNVYEASTSQNSDRIVYYERVELQNLVNELLDKYTSIHPSVGFLMLPIIVSEYCIRGLPIMFKAFGEIFDYFGGVFASLV